MTLRQLGEQYQESTVTEDLRYRGAGSEKRLRSFGDPGDYS
jgi:hypothetical protein